jgi:ATP-dependent helicase HrpB
VPLPIDPYLDSILKAGQNHSTLLIKASPGSGKTTRLPWAFARSLGGRVLVLEPRRLAAKLAAQRIAFEENFEIGKEVGYHFRFERKVSPETKLIFYTEGTFLRTLIHDPLLKDVAMVILDEFHERHLETDVALSALRSIQNTRPEFKIVLMSATLDTKIFDYFTDSQTIEIEAPRFPVELHYLPNQPSVLNEALEMKVKKALQKLPTSGDALVFVPGMREMLKIQSYLADQFGEVHLLHAELSKEEQEKTLEPSGHRKIILATNIAESSVTIPGIKFVIDSGIQRQAQFSPWTGLKTLVDKPITQSSAIQRAGRAGRTSAGICHRLYAEQDFKERSPFTIPEILSADLTDTALLVSEIPQALIWFTPPPAENWNKALKLNKQLGSLDPLGSLTPLGRKMMSYPLDARLSRALVAGENLSMNQKKKLLRFISEEIEGDRYGTLMNRLGAYLKVEGPSDGPWERSLLMGFVDQVAKFREKQHDFIHYSGKTIRPHRDQKELHHDYYLILDVSQRQEAVLTLPILEEWLYEVEPFPFEETQDLELGDRVAIKSQTKLGSIVIDESLKNLSWSLLTPSLGEKIFSLYETPFRKKLEDYKNSETFGRLSYWAKIKNLDLPLALADLTPKNYLSQFETLSWDQFEAYVEESLKSSLLIQGLDLELPTKIDLGGKRELKIHYPLNMDPYVEAPIQDFYGQKKSPAILGGKVPLTLKLLGPQRMPIQVTRDLVGFWAKTYPEMKKVWLREYPRHHWPEDPTTAKPLLLKRML